MKCEFVSCKKKINTFSTPECKCGMFFCNNHRNMLDHICDSLDDMKKQFREQIKTNNPQIKKEKITKI